MLTFCFYCCRFVKEKRPTISPNFNFLGQLIEFEKELRDRGRVTAKANPAKTTTSSSSSMTCTTIKVTKMEQTKAVVTKCDTPLPKSSFCRRRKGPSLSRPSYMYSTSDGFLDNGSRGAGVILDLHVSVPANGSSGEQSLRRLGSDGVEDDNEGSQDDYQSSFVMPVTSPFHQNSPQQKSNSFPRAFAKQGAGGCGGASNNRIGCSSMFRNRIQMQRNFSPLMLTADPDRGNHFGSASDHSRPATAPNTPSLLVFAGSSGDQNNMTSSESPEHSFNGDVEMTSPSEANQRPSPPSPITRDSFRTDPTSFYVSYEHNGSVETSSAGMRFMSRKTRSPKIMKKTFNPNLQRPYGVNFRQTSRHRQQFEGSWNLQLKTPQKQQCESPSTDRLSNLTLSSPVKTTDDPLLEVIGSRLTPSAVDPHNSNAAATPTVSSSSPSVCNIRKIPNRNSNTGEPFKLCTGNELKPRWRNRNPSASSGPAASGVSSPPPPATSSNAPEPDTTIATTSSSQSSSQSSSLNHCNLEIVGLS